MCTFMIWLLFLLWGKCSENSQSACSSTHRCGSFQHWVPHLSFSPKSTHQGRVQGPGRRASAPYATVPGRNALPYCWWDVHGWKEDVWSSWQASPPSVPSSCWSAVWKLLLLAVWRLWPTTASDGSPFIHNSVMNCSIWPRQFSIPAYWLCYCPWPSDAPVRRRS